MENLQQALDRIDQWTQKIVAEFHRARVFVLRNDSAKKLDQSHFAYKMARFRDGGKEIPVCEHRSVYAIESLRLSSNLLVLAATPVLAQVSSGPIFNARHQRQDTAAVTPRQHAPRRVAGLRPDPGGGNVTISDSTNWSGYGRDWFVVHFGEGIVDRSVSQLPPRLRTLTPHSGGH